MGFWDFVNWHCVYAGFVIGFPFGLLAGFAGMIPVLIRASRGERDIW